MSLRVRETGALTTVQDRGRTGWAHLGVPRGGALDAPAAALAQRLVGNPPAAALLEVTLGGLVVEASGRGHWVAVTGAPAALRVGARARAHAEAVWLPRGERLELGTPRTGVRSYLAVAGGLAVEPVLGSRATDTLAWVGPARVAVGDLLPVGVATWGPRPHDVPRPPAPGPLRVHPGPRAEWIVGGPAALAERRWSVLPDSDRVGLRLEGPPLERVAAARGRELPSEGMVLGAVQVPPDGRPVVFLADHPPTGGYPVAAVVDAADLWKCGQARLGEQVRFTLVPPDR